MIEFLFALVFWAFIISVLVGGWILLAAGYFAWHDRREARRDAQALGEIADFERSWNFPTRDGRRA